MTCYSAVEKRHLSIKFNQGREEHVDDREGYWNFQNFVSPY